MIYFPSIILDTDATSVGQRVPLRADDIPLGEQTVAQVTFYFFVLLILNSVFYLQFNLLIIIFIHVNHFLFQVLQSAKEQLSWSLLK